MSEPAAAALERLADALRAAPGRTVAVTGAGISVASGIPDFRSPTGIWARYDPFEYGHIAALHADPAKVWDLLWELDALVAGAEPNPAHHALAVLEARGLLAAVITQNPDGLHHAAGSHTVHEIHGTGRTLSCLDCARRIERVTLTANPGEVPRCDACGGVLRPDVTLFGEELPGRAIAQAWRACETCTHLLVIGTSAEVEPAASLPALAREHGARVWEINPTAADTLVADERIPLPAEEALPALLEHLDA